MFSFNRKKNSNEPIQTHPIYAIGDSHTRAFSFNTNFFPLFLGAGKTHCFISDKTVKSLTKDVKKVLKKLGNARIMFVLGEPDTRYYLGKGWYPWDGEVMFEVDDFKPYVEASIQRYDDFLAGMLSGYACEFWVLNVTPTERVEQNKIADYYNHLLKKVCEKHNILFIEINQHIYEQAFHINKEYLGDTVHLNNKIQPLVESYLMEKGLLHSSGITEQPDWDHVEVKDGYIYNKQFGCYTLK